MPTRHDAPEPSAEGQAGLPTPHKEDPELTVGDPVSREGQGVRGGARQAPGVPKLSAREDVSVVSVVAASARAVIVPAGAANSVAIRGADLRDSRDEGATQERSEGEEDGLHGS